jgi:DNA-binding MarR family transcriptional regulator
VAYKFSPLIFDDFEKMDLSIHEWHVCDYIAHFYRNNNGFSGMTKEIADRLKLGYRAVMRCIDSLMDKGYVIKEKHGVYRTTSKWNFPMDVHQ